MKIIWLDQIVLVLNQLKKLIPMDLKQQEEEGDVDREEEEELQQVKEGIFVNSVEQFSAGVRNPTSFLAGALGIYAECFFAGVCCGGLFTLPIQLGIGFLLRERPVVALASVATVVLPPQFNLHQITALHATDEKRKLEMIWSQQTNPKFYGTSVEASVHGKRELKLLNHGEKYVMNTPKLLIRFIPVPRTDWTGNVTIRCEESGLLSELCFTGKPFLGFGGNNRSVKGRIIDTSTSKTIYEVDGHWDRVVTIKDVNDKHKTKTIIYNGKEALSNLKTPEVKDEMGLWTSESAVVWSEVSQSILNKDWTKAREAKQEIEEKEREVGKERKSKGEKWVPKHFNLSKSNYAKEQVYECSPKQKWVPPAPIVCNNPFL